MRKLAALVVPTLILVIILAAIGCGGEEAATPTPVATTTPVVTGEPTASPSVAPTATPIPTPTKTPETAPQMVQCRFYGSVRVDGAAVPEGTIVTIIVEGDEYQTTTPAAGYTDPSTYAQLVKPPAGTTYADGAAVTFKIGEYTADQTGSWAKGGNFRTNLTASSS